MLNIVILYHSKTGNTKALAEAISEGAQTVSDTDVHVVRVDKLDQDQVVNCHALIVGSPVIYGLMSVEMKSMLDGLEPIKRKLHNKVGAAFVTGSDEMGGKESALLSILQTLMMFGMIIVGDPQNPSSTFGLTCIESPAESDAKNARAFGKHIAEITKQLNE
jgi:NAD(P)H dehydrogenase (quinone)